VKGLESYLTEEELKKKDELLTNVKPLDNYWQTALANDSVLKTFI